MSQAEELITSEVEQSVVFEIDPKEPMSKIPLDDFVNGFQDFRFKTSDGATTYGNGLVLSLYSKASN